MPFLAPLIEGVLAWCSRILFSRLGMWIASAAVFLGLELAATGVALPAIRDQITDRMGGIPADIAQWMGVLKIDVYVTVVLSAYAAAAVKSAVLRRRNAT